MANWVGRWNDWMWGRGAPVRLAVSYGLPFGIFLSLYSLIVRDASVLQVAVAVPFGVIGFGSFMSLMTWRWWRGARDLDPIDRVAVVHAFRLDEEVTSERQAVALLEYCDLARRSLARDMRYRRVFVVVPCLAGIFALVDSFTSTVGAALWSWTVFLLCLVSLYQFPRRLERRQDLVERAEEHARGVLSAADGSHGIQ